MTHQQELTAALDAAIVKAIEQEWDSISEPLRGLIAADYARNSGEFRRLLVEAVYDAFVVAVTKQVAGLVETTFAERAREVAQLEAEAALWRQKANAAKALAKARAAAQQAGLDIETKGVNE